MALVFDDVEGIEESGQGEKTPWPLMSEFSVSPDTQAHSDDPLIVLVEDFHVTPRDVSELLTVVFPLQAASLLGLVR